jgi:hypothetical protein
MRKDDQGEADELRPSLLENRPGSPDAASREIRFTLKGKELQLPPGVKPYCLCCGAPARGRSGISTDVFEWDEEGVPHNARLRFRAPMCAKHLCRSLALRAAAWIWLFTPGLGIWGAVAAEKHGFRERTIQAVGLPLIMAWGVVLAVLWLFKDRGGYPGAFRLEGPSTLVIRYEGEVPALMRALAN